MGQQDKTVVNTTILGLRGKNMGKHDQTLVKLTKLILTKLGFT